MGNVFATGGPQELYEFRKLNSSADDIEIPERAEYRRVTDKKYLITFFVFAALLLPFLIYTLVFTDFRRLFHGYDNCGNICGFQNSIDKRWSCTGQDMTKKPYLLGDHGDFQCVAKCPDNYLQIIGHCERISGPSGDDPGSLTWKDLVPTLQKMGAALQRAWWAITLSLIACILLSFGMLSLFRCAVAFVVWFILIGSIVFLAAIAGGLWYLFFTYDSKVGDSIQSSQFNDKGKTGLAVLAAVPSIIVLVLICVLTCFIKRVKLIIQLFKEAAKAIFSVPCLVTIPIYTALSFAVLAIIFLFLTLAMGIAGKLTELPNGDKEYQHDIGMYIALGYNFFMFLWCAEYITGVQYYVIAGSVATWFFAKNKEHLGSPVFTATKVLARFHTGTIAIGSLVIALMTIVRQLIKSLASGEKTRWLIDCCLENVEEFVRFLSKNAYIQTAMHGQPFFKSGKRAAKLLVNNAVNVIAINSIGDYVLGIAALILWVLSVLVSVGFCKWAGGDDELWFVPCVLTAIICIFIVNCFFALFESTIDTIFICFCEDTTLNDGMARPYHMSKGLMQFIEDSKAIMPDKK